MSQLTKFCLVLIVLCALVFWNNPASATSENEDMPNLLQVNAWNANFGVSENYVEDSYKDFIKTFPKGHVDKLKDPAGNVAGIVFYYYDQSSKGYGALYYDSTGKKTSPGCSNDLIFYDSYKGDGSSTTEEVKDDTQEENSEDESDEKVTDDTGTTYNDLLDVLEEDDTNEKEFSSSKECAKSLINGLPDRFHKDAVLVKATFKATGSTGKHLIRYCAGIETSDEGLVYIDSYSGKAGNGIDKRVTVLKAGQKWKAESACKSCSGDETGRYNRGKVSKVQEMDL